jgi:hypothetical protein
MVRPLGGDWQGAGRQYTTNSTSAPSGTRDPGKGTCRATWSLGFPAGSPRGTTRTFKPRLSTARIAPALLFSTRLGTFTVSVDVAGDGIVGVGAGWLGGVQAVADTAATTPHARSVSRITR